MVKIRLKRIGSKKNPFYRIIVAPARSPRDGESIERLGTINPRQNPPQYDVHAEKAIAWLNKGAQPTEIVRNIFRKTGIYQQWLAQKASKAATPTTT